MIHELYKQVFGTENDLVHAFSKNCYYSLSIVQVFKKVR